MNLQVKGGFSTFSVPLWPSTRRLLEMFRRLPNGDRPRSSFAVYEGRGTAGEEPLMWQTVRLPGASPPPQWRDRLNDWTQNAPSAGFHVHRRVWKLIAYQNANQTLVIIQIKKGWNNIFWLLQLPQSDPKGSFGLLLHWEMPLGVIGPTWGCVQATYCIFISRGYMQVNNPVQQPCFHLVAIDTTPNKGQCCSMSARYLHCIRSLSHSLLLKQTRTE